MKKRRMRVTALLTALCVCSASMSGVSAAAFEEVQPQEAFAELQEETEAATEDFSAETATEEETPTKKPSIGVLGVDMVWDDAPEDVDVSAYTLHKHLYRAENGVATQEIYGEEDGLVQVQVPDGETYTYAFDEGGWIRTGAVIVDGVEYYFQPKVSESEEEGEASPKTGRMQKDYWVLGTEWAYYGPNGAKSAAPDIAKETYQKDAEVLWAAVETPAAGKVPYRLYWLSAKDHYSRYFTAMDGLVKIRNASGKISMYAFDEEGYLLEGLQTVGEKEYYFITQAEAVDDSGVAVSGGAGPDTSNVGMAVSDQWVLTENGTRWLYFGLDGVRESRAGYCEINGEHYYLSEDGQIQTGIISVDGQNRYFHPNTVPMGQEALLNEAKGWVKDGEKWVYVNEDGSIETRTGIQYISSGSTKGWYCLDAEGVPMTKVLKKHTNGKYYYFGSDGLRVCNKVVTYNGKKYYVGANGACVISKWVKYNNNRYYFGANGVYVKKTGWQKIGNYWFYFSSNGNMYKNRFLSLSGKKYYVNENGTMLTGLREIKGYLYYFKGSKGNTRNGYMLTSSWLKYKGAWYYANGNGRMQKGWIALGTKQYYLNSKYQLVTDKWTKNPSGVRGYLDNNGLFRKAGWVEYNGKWRYLKWGQAGGWVTGWNWIGGYKYYFKSNGDMQTDLSSMPGFTGGPYLYDVNRTTCTITVLGKDESGNFTVPVIAFVCSVGLPGTPTPTSAPGQTYGMSRAGRWQLLMGPSYGQYATHVDGAGQGGIFFHSVAGSAPNPYALSPVEYNRLCSPASHGCIRMCVRDAKWIWDHWGSGGNRVRIVDRGSNIFYKPNNVPKVGPNVNYDPTDPSI